MSLKSIINDATLAHAKQWQEAQDSEAFCARYLQISLATPRYDHHIAELEERFESLLAAEDRRLHPTNVDFVTDIMTHSAHGALAQLFVIDALSKWADKISECTPEQVDSPMINGQAWINVAKEIKAKLDAKYGK